MDRIYRLKKSDPATTDLNIQAFNREFTGIDSNVEVYKTKITGTTLYCIYDTHIYIKYSRFGYR